MNRSNKMKKIIGATCTIRWNDTSNDVVEVYISCEGYNEGTDATDSGIADEYVFFYANDPASIEAIVDPNNTQTDWTILSIDGWKTLEESV
jgi:hypothetical protein